MIQYSHMSVTVTLLNLRTGKGILSGGIWSMSVGLRQYKIHPFLWLKEIESGCGCVCVGGGFNNCSASLVYVESGYDECGKENGGFSSPNPYHALTN